MIYRNVHIYMASLQCEFLNDIANGWAEKMIYYNACKSMASPQYELVNDAVSCIFA